MINQIDSTYAGTNMQPTIGKDKKDSSLQSELEKKDGQEDVSLSISKEGKELSEEKLTPLYQIKDLKTEKTKGSKHGGSDIARILEIARRISRGDKVPYKDERKLIEYNQQLYQAAKAAAMISEGRKHKTYKKSLFDEDNKDSMDEQLRELHHEKDGMGADAAQSSQASSSATDGSSDSKEQSEA